MSTAFYRDWLACCLKPLHAGRVEYRAGYRNFEPRDAWYLLAVETGSLAVRTSAGDLAVPVPGHLLLAPGRRARLINGPQGIAGWSCHFAVLPTAGAGHPLARLESPVLLPGAIAVREWTRMAGAFDQHRARSPEAVARVRPILESLLLDLLGTVLPAVRLRPGGTRPPEWLEDLAQWIYVHALDRKLRLADLARQSGLSIAQLTVMFRRHFNQPPMAFLRRQRIHQAARLLRDRPDQSVTEIALRCGFGTANLFIRHFQREVGQPPGAWRADPRARLKPLPTVGHSGSPESS